MIKQIWTVRNLLKLLNGFIISFSSLILGYTILNLLVLESNLPIKTFLLFGESSSLNKHFLLIIPIIGLAGSIYGVWLSNKPKKLNTRLMKSQSLLQSLI